MRISRRAAAGLLGVGTVSFFASCGRELLGPKRGDGVRVKNKPSGSGEMSGGGHGRKSGGGYGGMSSDDYGRRSSRR